MARSDDRDRAPVDTRISGRVSIRFRFRAPWCRDLVATTLRFVAACGIVAAMILYIGQPATAILITGLCVMPMVLSIRGYEVEPGTLSILRLLWRTRLPLGARPTATIRPGVLIGSSRVGADGSFFSYSGRFLSSELGQYRAFATDPDRTVALTTTGGTVVISPDDPLRFLMALDLLHLREHETGAAGGSMARRQPGSP